MQEELQRKYTGGTVQHLYMNEAISSAAACKLLVKRSLEKFRLPALPRPKGGKGQDSLGR